MIGPIINRKGNPLKMMEMLSEYFDFGISEEDGNVFLHRKLHAGIYEVAVWRYREIVRWDASVRLSRMGIVTMKVVATGTTWGTT